ncbi:MAG TPA: PQQ-binding-like beta-propeller repeat protein [Kofleriaceae bacterium]|nr:PQQ-binding-like beta-propeller repeat protein [Kofleriaceae bacterium]
MSTRAFVVGWLVVGAACRQVPPAPPPAPSPAPAQTAKPPAPRNIDWPAYNNTLTGERFAAVPGLGPAEIKNLQRVCSYDTRKDTSAQTGPIAIDGTLYLTDDDSVYAVDAATCRERWRHHRAVDPPGMLRNNHGVAFLDGKLVRGYADGRVIAIDARTGRELWSVTLADPRKGESMPAAPIAWNGLVYVGTAGGDMYGVRGRIYALRIGDGHTDWRFDVIPDTPEVLATWPKADTRNLPTGGGLWTSFSLDTQDNVLYASAGNAAPDFMLALRPGKSLYTNAVLAIDARAGTLLAYVQPIGDDEHDHDVAAAPALIATRGGKQLALTAAKDGRAYGIEVHNLRTQPELVVGYHVDTTTRENLDTRLNTKTPVRFCPGTQGGSEWNGAAYSPQLNTAFVGAVDWCTTIRLRPPEKLLAQAKPNAPFTGTDDDQAPFGAMDPPAKWRGWLTAFDADSGQIKWRYQTPAPILAGVTVTEGGVVLAADLKGTLRAFDGTTGDVLWQDRAGNATGGGLIAYAVAGRPYIAVVTGQPSPLWPVDPKATAQVVVYSPTAPTAK